MSGKARGRARGRARGGAAEQSEPPRRPGDVAPMKTPSEAARAEQNAVAAVAAMPGSGRATHRGGTRSEPRPGDQLASSMRRMDLSGGGGDASGGRRGRFDRSPEKRTRPDALEDKRGSSGTKMQVFANYFKLLSAPNWHIYQYRVDFSPLIDSMKMRSIFLKDHRELLGPIRSFDGQQLFLPKRLPQTETVVYSLRQRDQEKIQITIKLTAELPPDSPTTMQIFNVIFRRILAMMDMKQVQRHYFNPQQAVLVKQHKLEVWPGFITAIARFESSVLLNMELSHKILRTDTVLDKMYEVYELSQQRRQSFEDMARKELLGQIVLTRYNNKTYRVDDIDFSKTPSSKFSLFNGSETDFISYYEEHYHLKISDMDQPLIVSNPKKRDRNRGDDQPILLVPELCTMTGLSDEVRSNFHIMKDIATHTRIGPDGRQRTMMQFMEKMNSNEEARNYLEGWGLRFDRELVRIDARTIDPEVIHQNQGSFSYRMGNADWSRDMKSYRLIDAKPLNDWILVFTRRDSPKAQDFYQALMRVTPSMGIQVGKPQMIELPDDGTAVYLRSIKERVKKSTQMVVCILSTNKKDRYDTIKKLCCVQQPVPSQCILAKTLSKPQMLMSVATKIALQLNCKLGGELWAVNIPLKGLMICGIDSYHDSVKKGRSVGAFVASLNQRCTRYYSRCIFQHTAQELLDGIKVCLKASLEEFHKANGALPQRIVLYRDGVGEGQLNVVIEHEVPQILQTFQTIGQQYSPQVSIFVVTKRINTRFFARGGRGLDNPPAGTVVDSEVTKAERYDFFLVSQSVRQGTVSPTHYNIVWDTMNLGPEKMQRLTYKMTHLYYNWPGTIRVPAPCQYAHKLAFLVGQSLHEEPHIELADKLYYL